MKKFLERFFAPIRRSLAEFPWLGIVGSTVLLAMLINLVSETLVTSFGLGWSWLVMVLLGLAAAAYMIVLDVNVRQRKLDLGPLREIDPPRKHKGLIFIYSNLPTFQAAVQHHLPELRHCWLLVTPERQAEADEAKKKFNNVTFSDSLIQHLYHSQACYEAVKNIFQTDVPRLGFEPKEIIADITGGTKPMTAGMVVACVEGDYALEHVAAKFDPEGKPIGPVRLIEIRMGGA